MKWITVFCIMAVVVLFVCYRIQRDMQIEAVANAKLLVREVAATRALLEHAHAKLVDASRQHKEELRLAESEYISKLGVVREQVERLIKAGEEAEKRSATERLRNQHPDTKPTPGGAADPADTKGLRVELSRNRYTQRRVRAQMRRSRDVTAQCREDVKPRKVSAYHKVWKEVYCRACRGRGTITKRHSNVRLNSQCTACGGDGRAEARRVERRPEADIKRDRDAEAQAVRGAEDALRQAIDAERQQAEELAELERRATELKQALAVKGE